MAGADCPIPVQFCAIRIARLDASGLTPAGSNNMYVMTDKQITATFKHVYREGDEFTVPNGCGGVPLAVKAPPTLKWGELDLEIATCDPEFLELAMDGSLITVGGNSEGYAEPAAGAAPGPGVSVELFQKAYVGNQQAVAKPWVWTAIPKAIFVENDNAFGNAPGTVNLSAICYENSSWGNGPNNDWPSGATSSRVRQFCRATALPTGACGYQATPVQV